MLLSVDVAVSVNVAVDVDVDVVADVDVAPDEVVVDVAVAVSVARAADSPVDVAVVMLPLLVLLSMLLPNPQKSTANKAVQRQPCCQVCNALAVYVAAIALDAAVIVVNVVLAVASVAVVVVAAALRCYRFNMCSALSFLTPLLLF